MMTLYYADYNDSGEYIQEGETEKYDSAVMKQHDDYFYLKQDNPIYTDAQGYYRWDVPTGLWYVTADADGYLDRQQQRRQGCDCNSKRHQLAACPASAARGQHSAGKH